MPAPTPSTKPSVKASMQAIIARQANAVSEADGFFPTAINGLTLTRSRTATLPHHGLYRSALCLVAQGAKQAIFGENTFHYDEMQALVVSVEMPILGNIVRADDDVPYLGLILEFDTRLMRDVLDQLDDPPKPTSDNGPGVFVQDVGGQLADSVLRLLELLETPQAIPVLSASIMREIYFWLLMGPHGHEVCKLATADSHTARLSRAINLLRDFTKPIRSEQLAAAAQMSASSFHQHFKALTSMTPLQFQKQLRLLEARRLMLIEAMTATTAAYKVGYESPSQFSREYARLFGSPPRRDVEGLRALSF
jgi:AraC-like DNA-binding protein